jgi:hypothetical protein
MNRQSSHHPTGIGERTVTKCTQSLKKFNGALNGISVWRLEPLECFCGSSPRGNGKHRGGQIDPMDFSFSMRRKSIPLVPEANSNTRPNSSGAPGTLISRIFCNSLKPETINGAGGIVSRHFLKTSINNGANTRHR